MEFFNSTPEVSHRCCCFVFNFALFSFPCKFVVPLFFVLFVFNIISIFEKRTRLFWIYLPHFHFVFFPFFFYKTNALNIINYEEYKLIEEYNIAMLYFVKVVTFIVSLKKSQYRILLIQLVYLLYSLSPAYLDKMRFFPFNCKKLKSSL